MKLQTLVTRIKPDHNRENISEQNVRQGKEFTETIKEQIGMEKVASFSLFNFLCGCEILLFKFI